MEVLPADYPIDEAPKDVTYSSLCRTMSETPKFPATNSTTAETTSGKMFESRSKC